MIEDIGLYIHIPFCLQKCRYCDFYSLPGVNDALIARYCRALQVELQLRAEEFADRVIKTVYLGGGTPSLLDGRQLGQLLQTVKDNYNLDNNIEVSMEANPATLTSEKLEQIRQHGVNRISLGVQSFSQQELDIMGRVHTVKDVLETVAEIHKAGFININIDLIYGVPGQTMKSWRASLKRAIDCAPTHISMYLLQLSEGTAMARDIQAGRLNLLGEDQESGMYEEGINILTASGLQQYEISNFSRPGFQCRHNLLYWHACEYIGAGAGAVSFKDGRRSINQAEVKSYIENLEKAGRPISEELELMDCQQRAVDAIILGLRLCDGIGLREFEKNYGINIYKQYPDIIEKFTSAGLLKTEYGRLKFTRKGYFLSNQVLCCFIN